jgi:hypothetical protein
VRFFEGLDTQLWGSIADWTLVALTLVGATAAVWGLSYAAGSIRSQTENSRSEKIADSILDFERRYQEVAEARLNITVAFFDKDEGASDFSQQDRLALQRYFDYFWSLQYSQWMFYRMGLIPREVYRDWVEARIVEFSSERHAKIANVSAIDGWMRFSRRTFQQFTRFSSFVDQVADLAQKFGHEYFIKHRDAASRQDELGQLLAQQDRDGAELRGEARRGLRKIRRRR